MASCLSVKKNLIDWAKCCLCQTKSLDKLQTPKTDGYSSLEQNLTQLHELGALPSFLYDFNLLNEGPGIALTLHSHAAVYHKNCRSACNDQKVKRAQEKQTVSDLDDENPSPKNPSPKNLRSRNDTANDDKPQAKCIICIGKEKGELQSVPHHKARSMDVDRNLKNWSVAAHDFLLHARLVTNAADAHAADLVYHLKCYTDLRYRAEMATAPKTPEQSQQSPEFDPLVIAQLVTYMIECKDKVFQLSTLRKLYMQRLAEVGRPADDTIHSTRFKNYLLEHLPTGWNTVSKAGNNTFISHTDTMGKILSEANTNQNLKQDDALLLMKAASPQKEVYSYPGTIHWVI